MRKIMFTLGAILATLTAPAFGQEAGAAAVAPLRKMVADGRVTGDRLPAVLKAMTARGNEHDLAFVFGRAVAGADGLSAAGRVEVLTALAEAAETRKVVPAGDLAGLATLLESAEDSATQVAALKLASLWKSASALSALRKVIAAEGTSLEVRDAALDTLTALDPAAARATVADLLKSESAAVQIKGVVALARFDAQAAAQAAAAVAGRLTENDDPAPLMAAFLARKDGADLLAKALETQPLSADVAKLLLSAMYAQGRSEAVLTAVLGKMAGIENQARQLTEAEMAELVAEIAAKGDPGRGELIFRRSELNCVKCHALRGAGGNIGPDLSAIGGSSPADYLVNSLLVPDLAIKEQYETLMVLTGEGNVVQGLLHEETEERLVLKDAEGKLHTLAVDDIEARQKGKSLMPQGLTNILTRSQFVDLVAFLAVLGKPGPYAVQPVTTLQRWQVLDKAPGTSKEFDGSVRPPSLKTFQSAIYEAAPSRWRSVYAKFDGQLPLADIAKQNGPVLALMGEIEVTQPGVVGIRFDADDALEVWLDDLAWSAHPQREATLSAGRHRVFVWLDLRGRKLPTLRAEIYKPTGSTAEYTIVAGQ